MEQTLFICRSVDVYMIPPREGRGHISGNWLVENKIATCRLRVLSIDNEKLEVRLEDLESGEIFGACPVPRGQREAAVESAVDSSRNFVLRIVDPASGRHAFLGVNFAERSNAFDFNVSITDFEKRAQREDELKRFAASGGTATATAAAAIPEAALLYQHHDLSLKDGEHIRVEVKKKEGGSSAAGGGFLSRLGAGGAATTAAAAPGKLVPLAPPPAPAAEQPSEAAVAFGAAAVQTQQPQPQAAAPAPASDLAPKVVASTEEGWATF